MNWKKLISYRWLLLGLALAALVSLTGMNVYSLYSLHEHTIHASHEKQKNKLEDLTNQTRHRLTRPLRDRWNLNMSHLQNKMIRGQDMPENFYTLLSRAYEDSIFTGIYFSGPDCEACDGNGPIQRYNHELNTLEWTYNIPDAVKDGIGMSRTRMRVLISEYQWRTRIFFDTHRSLTITLVNNENQQIVGFICLLIDEDYLINSYLQPLITSTFGSSDDSGLTVWLHDWTKNRIIATNDKNATYNHRQEDIVQNFPEMLNNWNLKASFAESPMISASRSSLYRNLFILGVAVFLLIGSIMFMFFTAQRERELSVRQAGFLANVTHELKTPLAVMQAAGENLSDGRVKNEERLKSYGRHIYDESVRLRGMIDKLLDVAKTDAKQNVVKPIPVNLYDLVKKYMADNISFLESRGFKVDIDAEKDLPLIMIDPNNFETIFGNLVENAVKYSFDEKYIKISVFKSGKNIQLDIADHGVGIPKESQKLVFDKFYRCEDSNTAKTKGHGLGLSIVKKLTELNQGQISLKSTYRKGSTFSLHFPIFLQHKNGSNGIPKPAVKEINNVS